MAKSTLVRRLLHPVYRGLETKVHPLRYLFIEITQRCNLKCLHCGSDCTKDTQLDELSTKEWVDFFEYLPKNFDPKELVLVVTGGEPLCCPNLERILQAIHNNHLAWGMVSNGYGLTKRKLDMLLRTGLSSMTISLDGTRAPHDWLRGLQGSYDRAVDAIARVAQARLPFFDVVTCVNPHNLNELDKVQEVLVKNGVKQWRLFAIFPKGRALEHNKELILSDEQLRQMFDWIANKRKQLADSDFKVEFSCEGFLPPKMDAAVRSEPYFCRAGISIGSVLCDGSISGCPNISRSLIQGNIRTDDFKDVWDNRYQQFRDRGWMKQGPCVECKDWKKCKGNSMHLWDDECIQTTRCFKNSLAEKSSE